MCISLFILPKVHIDRNYICLCSFERRDSLSLLVTCRMFDLFYLTTSFGLVPIISRTD